MSTATQRAYSSGHFHLQLGDYKDAGYLKSVSGGEVKGAIIDEKVGPDCIQRKHLSTIEISPISIEVGMAVAKPLFEWVSASWDRQIGFQRRNGTISHATFDQNIMLEQAFEDALIIETTFPTLDASSKEPAYLTVKFQPEKLAHKTYSKSTAKKLPQVAMPSKEKLWLPSNFELVIYGFEAACKHINKVDSISVKQKVKPFHFGTQRRAQLEPSTIEFGNITLYLAAAHADPFIKWHHDYVVEGARDTTQEKRGHLTFIGPGKDQRELFSIEMDHINIFSLSIEKSEANADAVKRVKIELYVEEMKLKYGSGF